MMKKLISIYASALIIIGTSLLSACSSTSGVPEGDQLFTGLKPIQYKNYDKSAHFLSTKCACRYGMPFTTTLPASADG